METTEVVNLDNAETAKVLEKLKAVSVKKWKLEEVGDRKFPDEPEWSGPKYKGGRSEVKDMYEFTKCYSTKLRPNIKVEVRKRRERKFSLHSYYGYVESVHDDLEYSLVLKKGKFSFAAIHDDVEYFFMRLEGKSEAEVIKFKNERMRRDEREDKREESLARGRENKRRSLVEKLLDIK
ncbi:MAG: hypothetical protein AABW79_04115 [Nanoarchaeota archaeon]